MAQEKVLMNGVEIWQPDEGLEWLWQPTYSADSTRAVVGVGYFTPLFTVEQLRYTATHVPASEVSKILKIIASGAYFTLHYFSPYYGHWRDGLFYVGEGQTTIKTLKFGEEYFSDLSFNMVGVNPLGR